LSQKKLEPATLLQKFRGLREATFFTPGFHIIGKKYLYCGRKST